MHNLSNDSTLDNIDVIEFFKLLWKRKISIIVITCIFAIFSVVYALSLPNKYESTALLKLTQESQSSAGGLSALASQYGGLASMAGMSMPTANLDNGVYAIKYIKSREFAKHLMSFDMVKANLMAVESYDLGSDKLIYDSEVYNENSKTWVREPDGIFKSEPTYLEVHETALKELEVNRDIETGLITISFEHFSPKFSQELVSLVIKEVNNVTRKIKLDESQAALFHLQGQLASIKDKDSRSMLNMLIKTQLNDQMMATVKDNYLLTVIDSPIIPVYKSSPKRARICILITLIGGLFSIIFVLVSNNFFRKD